MTDNAIFISYQGDSLHLNVKNCVSYSTQDGISDSTNTQDEAFWKEIWRALICIHAWLTN